MALINRLARLFKADFHAVLDQIEEPETLLNQSIREMDDELAAAERRIRLLDKERMALDARRLETSTTIDKLDEELDLCFATGKDELARGLVRRKLETERLLRRLDGALNSSVTSLADEKALLEENRAALESLRQKAAVYAKGPAGDRRSPHDAEPSGWSGFAVSDDEVEIAFLREQTRRSAS